MIKPMAKEPKNREVIRVHVEGGLVQGIVGVPLGVCVRVIDCDGDGSEDHQRRLIAEDREFTGRKTGNVRDEDGGDFLKGTDRQTLCEQIKILRDMSRDVINNWQTGELAEAVNELRFAIEEAERQVPHLTGKFPGDRKQITVADLQRSVNHTEGQLRRAKLPASVRISYQTTRLAVVTVPKRLRETIQEQASASLYEPNLKNGIEIPSAALGEFIRDSKDVGRDKLAQFLTVTAEQVVTEADGFLFV